MSKPNQFHKSPRRLRSIDWTNVAKNVTTFVSDHKRETAIVWAFAAAASAFSYFAVDWNAYTILADQVRLGQERFKTGDDEWKVMCVDKGQANAIYLRPAYPDPDVVQTDSMFVQFWNVPDPRCAARSPELAPLPAPT
jgi:hypothetical protein